MMWCVQVRLRDDAPFSEQNKCHEAVGAALDQKLSVWRTLEADSSNSRLKASLQQLPEGITFQRQFST